MIYLIPFIGAIISRMHGAGTLPKVWMGILWGIPFAITVWQYNPYLAPIALIMCALGKNTGHGNFFDLATMPQGKPERLEFIISWLKGKLPEYWYDVIGLSLVGFASVSGGLLIAPYNPLGACLIALCGLLKPIGYMIGWRFFKSPRSTEIGECIAGFIAFIPLAIIL